MYAQCARPSAQEPAASRQPRGDVTRKPYFSKLRSMLREAGLRPTRQRVALAALIFDQGDRHLTAEMLFSQASLADFRLSLATVYNTLHQFSRAGLLREIALFGSTIWYDTNTGPHFHFYVEQTGELIDIPDGFSSNLPPLSIPEGFDLAGVDMIARLRLKPA